MIFLHFILEVVATGGGGEGEQIDGNMLRSHTEFQWRRRRKTKKIPQRKINKRGKKQFSSRAFAKEEEEETFKVTHEQRVVSN